MAIILPTDSITNQAAADYIATPEGQKAIGQWMDEVDFRDRFGTRRKDLTERQAIALVFAEASVNLCGDYLVIEGMHGAYAWDPSEAEWVDADDFAPLQD